MIISFYDKDFNALQDNASLVIDSNSYSLIKRPIEINDLSCTCEAFTENIQPTFIVIKDDVGRYIYGSLAGIPILNADNKTEINGTDLKTLLSSDVLLTYSYGLTTVGQVINYIFNQWAEQVNQGTISYVLEYLDNVNNIELTDLSPATNQEVSITNVYNALDELSEYLKYYDLYIDTKLDLQSKKVVFYIGKVLKENRIQNIKLWEYGVRNYGKWIADVNETQGYLVDKDANVWLPAEYKWILTSKNEITIDISKRDIYPIKRRVFTSDESREQASKDALAELLNSRYNENIEIPVNDILADFETTFNIYVKKGDKLYKSLPCGELRYNSSSYSTKNGVLVAKPYKIQIGYRYVGVDFI